LEVFKQIHVGSTIKSIETILMELEKEVLGEVVMDGMIQTNVTDVEIGQLTNQI
jgi:hypothetical protein